MKDLNKKILRGVFAMSVFMLVLILLPSWSLVFWQGWLYWGVFTLSVLVISLYFLRHDPELMVRRLEAGPAAEKERVQKIIQTFTGTTFVFLFIFPGLDHVWGWSPVVPLWLVVLADVLVALGFLVVFFTFKANSYTSAVIEIGEKQKLISSGPYAFVRHPMYAGAALLLLATPIALGSSWGLVFAIPAVGGVMWRLIEEEKFLVQNLPGYTEYQKKVHSRLIPFLW